MPSSVANYLNEPSLPHPLPVLEYHIDTPPQDYNLNFVWPVRILESSGVRLEPFIPSLHARPLFEAIQRQPPSDSVYRYFATPVPKTLAEYLTGTEGTFRSQPTAILFAIYDTSCSEVPQRLAGSIALWKASTTNLSVEIGFVGILPEFRRTHVTTHATGLLLKYALDRQPQGLGLRRTVWQANSLNEPSIRAALRLGFQHEGTIMYDQVLSPGKEGVPVPGSESPARHNWSGAITIADWFDDEEGGGGDGRARKRIEVLMQRDVVAK